MHRRRFLQGLAATGAAAGALRLGDALANTSLPPAAPTTGEGQARSAVRVRQAKADLDLSGHTALSDFDLDGASWQVFEDLRGPDGAITLLHGEQACVLGRRSEATYADPGMPYLGLRLAEIARSGADLLADRLLRAGEPDEDEVRRAAPPLASQLDPENYYGRLPWTTFVGTRQGADTMPVYTSGSTRSYHTDQTFADLHDPKLVARRREGLLGGWLPAVHKRVPLDEGRWYDILVFADVDANDRFVVQTWHRTALIEHGRLSKVSYGHSYPSYPPRRRPPAAAAFYRALLRFHDYWQAELADMANAQVPAPGWQDMARYAFARELVVRPGGSYPKYGAVDRDYYGNEYDGFQDTFTSSLYANLEWGRFHQAALVLDEYFEDFVQTDGMINMRGAETAQFGLTLSLLARYLRYTGDHDLLLKHRAKIEATAQLLLEMHDEALRLPLGAPGYGLIHGWNESDACLFPDPSLWWKPYYANSAMSARGLHDLASVWSDLVAGSETAARQWRDRARQLREQVERSLRANVRHDLEPPYIGPLPGVKLTFRESLAKETPSEQQWPHRAYAELLQADVLPPELAHLVIDCMRGHGATSLGVVANIGPVDDKSRDILGFISYGYAQQLLRLNRIDEYLLFLYAHRHHAHTPGSWTAGEVSDISGGMPLFCIPAQMTIPLLLRWALVFEDSEGETLYLGRAVARSWLASGDAVAISRAPTRWGPCGFRLRADRRGGIEGEVSLPERGTPGQIWLSLRLPTGKRLLEVSVDDRQLRPEAIVDDAVRLEGEPGQRITLRARYA